MNEERGFRRPFWKNRIVVGVSGGVTAAAVALSMAGAGLAQDDQNGESPSPDQENLQEGEGQGQEDQNGEGGDLSETSGDLNPDLGLESASVESFDVDDGNKEFVQFTFEEPITNVRDASGFELSGVSPDATVSGEDAKLVEGDQDSVLVAYESGTDLDSFNQAHATTGAVNDESDLTNIPSTVDLSGGGGNESDGTDAPRLQDISADDTLNQITYTFDRDLESEGAKAESFGFYTNSGREVQGTDIVSQDEDKVTVAFDNQVDSAEGYFNKANAVQDSRGLEAVPNTIDANTEAPQLESVSDLIGKTQFDFTFNEEVSNADAAKFVAYTEDGSKIEGSGVVQPDSDTVRVSFPEAQLYGETITMTSVGEEAVTSNDGSDTGNVITSDVIRDEDGGASAGPDLESVSVDESTGQVRYDFDQKIDDGKDYDPANFSLIDDAGDAVEAESFVEVDGRTVVLNFDRAEAESAEALAVEGGAVQNFKGDGNPVDTEQVDTGNNDNNEGAEDSDLNGDTTDENGDADDQGRDDQDNDNQDDNDQNGDDQNGDANDNNGDDLNGDNQDDDANDNQNDNNDNDQNNDKQDDNE